MRLFTPLSQIRHDMVLDGLLTKRKAPLSKEGLNQTLSDLTRHMSGPVAFWLAAFAKDEAKGKSEIKAADIERVDIMYADDNERYMPVFSDIAHLKLFKPELREGEQIYIADKQDLLDFLNLNGKVAACVLNPQDDDLLLYRMQLQNLIRVGKDMNL